LEETGMSYDLEVELIAAAHQHGLFTTPYVFSAEDARKMTDAGADLIVCHMGLTTGGSNGAGTAKDMDDCVRQLDEWSDAAAGGRRPRAGPDEAVPRLLRRQQHGTPPHRAGDHRADAGVHRCPELGGEIVARTYVSTVLPIAADRVWEVVRDFNGLPEWHPAIERSEIEGGGAADSVGSVRRLQLSGGGVVRERLVALDDA